MPVNESNPEPPMQSGAVDTHCHLFLLDGDPAEAVETARAGGVDTLVCVGIDAESSRRSVELAASWPGVWATAGMHPHDANAWDAEAAVEIEGLLANPVVVAVGECGLDFFRMRSPRPEQERALHAQVSLAQAYDLPLVIHVRDAWPEILRVLDEGSAERVVLHCFSGDAEIAVGCAERGWFLSFAGNVTYPKNAHLREAAAAVTLDRILVETDSPFLAPQRLRGRDNAPSNVVDVIEAVALARAESVEIVRETTAENARIAFPRLQ
ncbi:MAG TPA: TatD family hydrolase [Actinomycetota bacterium]|nr:TatD family hydrolase [Actinomycetota bacterium]